MNEVSLIQASIEQLERVSRSINNFLAAVDKADREGVLDYATIEKIAEKLKDGDGD